MIQKIFAAGAGALIGATIAVLTRKRRMHNCHKEVLEYHNDYVTLSQSERNKMKDRRNANRNRINKNLDNEDPKPIGFQTQGSYSMLTMVLDQHNDYDIDDGIYYNKEDLVGSRGGELTPRQAKKIVCDAAQDNSFKRAPEIRTNCVRVYYNDGSHVDIPVYRKYVEEDFWGEEKEIFEIAGATWKQSDPKSVTGWFKDNNISQSPDATNGRQMRRIVRLLKRFSRSRESWKSRIASGFVITALVVECYKADAERDDKALYDTMKSIHDRLVYDLEVNHPVLDEALTTGADDAKTKFLREKLKGTLNRFDELFDSSCDDATALEVWGGVFSSGFFFDKAKEAREENKAEIDSMIAGKSEKARKRHAAIAATGLVSAASGYKPWAMVG